MEALEIITLFSAAIVIGVFAVLFGGTLFLSFPLFQLFFPTLPLASIVGCIKFGSVIRNAAAVLPHWRSVETQHLWLIAPLGFGSLVGAYAITGFTQAVIPAVLITGWLLSEYAGNIKISQRLFWITAFIIGVYGGIFGAGILLLIIALMQLKAPGIVNARFTALTLEMAISAISVAIFIWQGFIVWHIALIWAAGGIVGGLIGGRIIVRTGKLNPKWQQWLIRAAFLFALVIAVGAML